MEEASEGFQQAGKVRCPYCSSRETELSALFGQQLLTMQYYCHTCHTPFEYIKDDEPDLSGQSAFEDFSVKKGSQL